MFRVPVDMFRFVETVGVAAAAEPPRTIGVDAAATPVEPAGPAYVGHPSAEENRPSQPSAPRTAQSVRC